jgi:hypothetical protein
MFLVRVGGWANCVRVCVCVYVSMCVSLCVRVRVCVWYCAWVVLLMALSSWFNAAGAASHLLHAVSNNFEPGSRKQATGFRVTETSETRTGGVQSGVEVI